MIYLYQGGLRNALQKSLFCLKNSSSRTQFQNIQCFSSINTCKSEKIKPSTDKGKGMNDEYGRMDSSGKIFRMERFELESGTVLKDAQICYNTFGDLNDKKDNLIIVCHALTGNSRVDQWWGDLLGSGKIFDTDKYMILCANVLGSCYGSTGPQSCNPDTNTVYGNTLPQITIRDTVRLHAQMVKEALGVHIVRSVIGGSMGGMQALEWCALAATGDAPIVQSAVVIGCGAQHSAWQIGISETQRQAIYADPKWRNGDVDMNDPPNAGLSVARQIAMISYRTALGYESKFSRRVDAITGHYEVKNYLKYQGTKFIERFDPVTYIKLTEQMDAHDLGRGREGGVTGALSRIQSRVLIMGIDSDLLYPLPEQQLLAAHIPNCSFQIITSPAGHDGFLLEQDQVSRHIQELLTHLSP